VRIIARKTLKQFWEQHPTAEQALLAWSEETENADWNSPQQLKEHYRNASILSNKRVVFNIKGNDFRLLVDIEYKLKIVFIVWIGTHKEYDNIDAKNIDYVKPD
jgi:mRNA interferase HigB